MGGELTTAAVEYLACFLLEWRELAVLLDESKKDMIAHKLNLRTQENELGSSPDPPASGLARAEPARLRSPRMRKRAWIAMGLQIALVLGVVIAVRQGAPLGVPGQWEWLRVSPRARIPWGWLALGAATAAGYAVLAALGRRALAKATLARECAWVLVLAAASVLAQLGVTAAAPDEYDLTKWAYVNFFTSSSGYFTIARDQARQDPWRFLADYPEWIERQDSLHIGTHPPGLIMLESVLERFFAGHPRAIEAIESIAPPSTSEGFRQLGALDRRPVAHSERAALLATAMLVLLACAGSVAPLYLLVRASQPAPVAWTAAALWPLAPSAILFQPLADAAYPLAATAAVALAAWSARSLAAIAVLLAFAAGVVLAFGTVFTMAFLPVGLIVALVYAVEAGRSIRARVFLIVAVGVGFVLPWLAFWIATAANPVTIALWNLHHHARFYLEYPRSYWLWCLVNPLELLVALGAASAVWVVWGGLRARPLPRALLSTLIVLLLVELSGRNLGEVARLWMFFMPLLLPAAAAGLERERAGPAGLAATVLLLGVQTLAFESLIQVVYPVD